MQVRSTAGFEVGNTVDIDAGTAIHEVNIIQAFGSLVFANPLQFAHPAGAVISQALILSGVTFSGMRRAYRVLHQQSFHSNIKTSFPICIYIYIYISIYIYGGVRLNIFFT